MGRSEDADEIRDGASCVVHVKDRDCVVLHFNTVSQYLNIRQSTLFYFMLFSKCIHHSNHPSVLTAFHPIPRNNE